MNPILTEAMKEIAISRREALRSAEEINLELMKNPLYKACEQNIARLSINLARARSDGKTDERSEKEYTDALTEKQKLLASFGYPNGIIPDFFCKKCNDTGVLNGSPCSCVKTRMNGILSKKLRSDGIPNFTFRDFSTDIVKDKAQKLKLAILCETLKKFASKFPDTKYLNVVLSGTTGVGKTFMLSAVANQIASRGFGVVFISAFELNTRFLKFHTSPLAERTLYLDDLTTCDLLVIDDLGSEPILKNVTLEYFLCLIEERTKAKKHTMFTTNLNANDILARYGERIFSRMFDKRNSTAYLIDGDDLRLK